MAPMKNCPEDYEQLFEKKIAEVATVDDPAHDLAHFKRVVVMAKRIAEAEGANMDIVVPAAWLHDLVIVPKSDPRRSQASRMSGEAAIQFLEEIGYPREHHAQIAHAIEAHSFSANIEPRSKEAAVVQDADRLDGIGAIGVARCFATAGLMKRAFYSSDDPFCETRTPDDKQFTIDHFYVKLFKTAETLKTAAGREEGKRRVGGLRRHDPPRHLRRCDTRGRGDEGGAGATRPAEPESVRNALPLDVLELEIGYGLIPLVDESEGGELLNPITILSTLPSAGIGALLALHWAGEHLTVVGVIGIILLMGIVKKNAILMIDFAIDAERRRGLSPEAAIREACRLRFRPIMMTTLAALFGALPLALAAGPGAELRMPLGVSIVGGLILSQI